MAKPGRPRKRPEGAAARRLRAKVTIPGAEKPVWISAYSRSELRRKKEEVRERYIDGISMRDIPFRDLVIEWFNTVKRPTIRSESTLNNWRSAINNHVLPCFPEQQLARAVRRADLQRCVDATSGMSGIITDLVCSVLRHAFDYALAEGVVRLNPSVSLSKPAPPPSMEKKPFTPQEEETLLRVAAQSEYGLMIYLLYYLGIRRGEMLGLRWEDFDFSRRIVHIQRDIDFNAGRSSGASSAGTLKTAAADRLVPLPDELIEVLDPLRDLPHLYLISIQGRCLSANEYRTRFNRLMRDAGMLELSAAYRRKAARLEAEGKRIPAPNLAYDYTSRTTAHRFRHHYITAKVEAGERPEIIMSIVGHRDYSTTINIYTHIQQTLGNAEPTRLSQVFKKHMT